MKQNESQTLLSETKSRNLLAGDLQSKVNSAAEFGLFPPVEVEVLATDPVTIMVSPKAGGNRSYADDALAFIARGFIPQWTGGQPFLFRGVEMSRLSQIISTGCDVVPSTSPIHATPYPSKALEYGNVVMAFDAARLDKTFRRVPKSVSLDMLNRLREEYSTMLEVDGDLWFSRLPPDDVRIGTIYESYYTFFIPGDPREALLVLFLIGDDRDALRAEFRRCGVSPPA